MIALFFSLFTVTACSNLKASEEDPYGFVNAKRHNEICDKLEKVTKELKELQGTDPWVGALSGCTQDVRNCKKYSKDLEEKIKQLKLQIKEPEEDNGGQLQPYVHGVGIAVATYAGLSYFDSAYLKLLRKAVGDSTVLQDTSLITACYGGTPHKWISKRSKTEK